MSMHIYKKIWVKIVDVVLALISSNGGVTITPDLVEAILEFGMESGVILKGLLGHLISSEDVGSDSSGPI